MQAQAILFSDVNEVKLGTVEVPDPGPGEVLVEAAYTGISPGTELRCLAGKQTKPWTWPFIPGYCMAGTVIANGSGTTTPTGTRVFCRGTERVSGSDRLWGGHISHAVVSEEAVFPLPEGVELLDASIIKLASIAYHGLRRSIPLPHERVAVVGLGPLGQIAARLHTLTGARVVAADLVESRVLVAQAAGVDALVPEGPLAEAFTSVFPNGADIVVDATGAPAVVAEAVQVALSAPWDDTLVPRRRYLVQGSYANSFSIPYDDAFTRELDILMSRDDQPRDVRAVLDLMQRDKLHLRDLISNVCPPEDAPAVYEQLRSDKGALLTAAFDWQQ